ncbi:hypothetical protein [Pyrobaculum calidifontis]|nr:hypothetical protein [Pyrobaculum calidifontis]
MPIRGAFAMRSTLIVILLAWLALAKGIGVVIYEVEISGELAEDIYGRGVEVVGVGPLPLFVAPAGEDYAVFAFTGNVTRVKFFNMSRAYVVVPRGPPPETPGDFYLETPQGRYPLRFRSGGPVLAIVDSLESLEKVLAEMGYVPQRGGRARLVGGSQQGRQPEPLPEPLAASVGSTVYPLGGVYFRNVNAKVGVVEVQPHGDIQVCSNVRNVAYVGLDVNQLLLGYVAVNGTVQGNIVVQIYKVNSDGTCSKIGEEKYPLYAVRSMYYTVAGVNPTSSQNTQIGVKVILNITSVSGSPVVKVQGMAEYIRTVHHGFEVSDYSVEVAWGDFAGSRSPIYVGARVSSILLGPYMMPDGVLQDGTRSLSVVIEADPVNGACQTLYWRLYINGYSYEYGSSTGVQLSGTCRYSVQISGGFPLLAVRHAKTLTEDLMYQLRISYNDGSAPFVRYYWLNPHTPLRGSRWAEVWKSTPNSQGKIPEIWQEPHLLTQLQLLGMYGGWGGSDATSKLRVHGLVSIFADSLSRGPAIVMYVTGRVLQPSGATSPVGYWEVRLRFPIPVSTGAPIYAAYVGDSRFEELSPPQWVWIAKMLKKAVDFLVGALQLDRFKTLIHSVFSYAVGQLLESAGPRADAANVDPYTLKLYYNAGWANDKPWDTVLYWALFNSDKFTTFTVTYVKVYPIEATPNINLNLRPSNAERYYPEVDHSFVKLWAFKRLTGAEAIYIWLS